MTNNYYDALLLILIISAQVLYAMIKKTLSVSSPYLIQSEYLSKMEFGMISTKFSLSYGISKLIGGVLSDVVSPKSLYVTGLMLGSAVNLIIAVAAPATSSARRSSSLFSIDMLWALNGMAQGIGGPAMNKLLVVSFDSSSRGSMLSILTFASNLGYLISPLVLLPLAVMQWQLPFLVCGSLGLAISFFIHALFGRENHSPNSAPHPSPSSSSSAPSSSPEGNESPEIAVQSPRSTAWSQLFLIHSATWFQIAMLLAAHVLTYFTLKGMHEWTGLYLIESRHVTIGESVELMLWNEVGGIAGSFCCGIISDLLGKRLGRHYCRRSPWIVCAASAFLCCMSVTFLSGAATGISISGVNYAGVTDLGTDPYSRPSLMLDRLTLRLWLFLAGFGINGPKTLLPFALMDLFPSSLAGSLSGIMGFLAQCGASYAGGGIGHILTTAKTRSGSERLGWEEVMATISASSFVIGLCILIPIAVLPDRIELKSKPKGE